MQSTSIWPTSRVPLADRSAVDRWAAADRPGVDRVGGGREVADSALYAMQCEAMEAIVSHRGLKAVAGILCEHVERLAPDVICSIASVDEEGRFHTLASPGLPAGFSEGIEGLAIGPDVGSCGAAAYTGEPVEVLDIDQDGRWTAYKGALLAAGLRACASVPVLGRDGRVLGTFGLYFRTCRGPDALERKVVATCAHLCALALEHEAVLERLQRTNQRFEAALTNISQGVCFYDGARRLIVANRRYAELYDIAPECIQPGMSIAEVAQLRLAAGSGPKMQLTEYLAWRGEVQELNESLDSVVELANGRVIAIHHRPMPDAGWVATHEDITERRRAEERAAHLARHDPLTGLANRAVFHERLAEALARVAISGGCAVLCLDLERFKAINDGFGHAAGDAALRAVAQRLLMFARKGDTVCRLGGDEFVILLTDVDDPMAAADIAASIVRRLSEPFVHEGQSLLLKGTVGLAIGPRDGSEPATLLKSADTALHRAKIDDPGSYRVFDEEMDAQRLHRIALERDLREALRERQFELAYQPVVDITTGMVCSFEALLRWHHPIRGAVSPAEFIPVAEEAGLIVPLGAWVLRTACREVAAWPGTVKVAVNLSASQFRNRALLGTVHQALVASGLPANRLELEITESTLLHNSAMTLAALHELRSLGLGIALDDFGTGYSSLSYLRSFPFSKIKIDQSFIRGLSHEEESGAILRAVVGIGRSLGMRTVAEGVETMAQMERVTLEGCLEVQGFLFSRPVAAAAARRISEDAAAGRPLPAGGRLA